MAMIFIKLVGVKFKFVLVQTKKTILMKKLALVLFFVSYALVCLTAQNRRYFDEVFSEVKVTADINYAVNATVLYLFPQGEAVPEQLNLDVYEPEGDTETLRPLVIILHDGNLLPPEVNGGCTGTRKDADNIEIATRLAKMGYVAAVADYRLGWSPIASTQTERIYTLINALYRGVQDSRTCIRFFRKDAANGNKYDINSDKITLWGIGSGGAIAVNSALLDTISDTYIPKFITGQGPMVQEFLNGDVNGTKVGYNVGGAVPFYPAGDTLCYPNHPGYSSEFSLTVNLSGVLIDTSLIDPDENPIISFHNPTDIYSPCGTNLFSIPPIFSTFETFGSCTFQPLLNAAGTQGLIINANLTDPLSLQSRTLNGNIEGFYPFLGNDSSPWSFASSSNPYGLANDPGCETLSPAHTAYIDTIMRYFAPRACAVLGLSADCALVGTKDLNPAQVGLSAIPNPSASDFILKSDAQFVMQNIEIVNLAGQRVAYFENVNNNVFEVKHSGLAPGVYFARVLFKEGISTQKLILH